MNALRTYFGEVRSVPDGLLRLCMVVVAIQIALVVLLAVSLAGVVKVIVGIVAITLTVILFFLASRTMAKRERRQLDALRSDFAANVSHELRTPITNIKGYAETMLDVGFEDAEQARKFIEVIKRNSDRLAAIVEDLLALAWLEQPGTKQSLAREMCELRPILNAVAAQFENAASAKNIALAVDAEPKLAAPINAHLIEQAVVNYVSNAIKYGPPESTVTISARLIREGNGEAPGGAMPWVEIAVHDKGPGIAPEHLPRIFERFYRVDKARSRELGGTGLGLAIVKHITRVHEGRVDVESEPGKGSTFRLILPAEQCR